MAAAVGVRARQGGMDGGGDFFLTSRPWLSLYGMRVRAVPPVGSVSHGGGAREKETSLIHRALPEELLVEVFARLPAQYLGRVACVCRRWRYTVRAPALWKEACFRAWQDEGEDALRFLQRRFFSSSWRTMWLHRPRIRFQGVYVSRNTYLRCGVVEWRNKRPVHMVCYYRYICFLPNGKVLYKTSPQVVRDVARQMQAAAHMRFPSSRVLAGGTDASSRAHDGIHLGRYSILDDSIQAALLYPGRRATLVQLKLRLRGTCVGANNRLDVLSLITGGVGHQATPRTPKEVDLLLQQHCRHRGAARGRGEGEGEGEGELEGGGVGGEGEEERDPLEVLAELDPEVPAVAHQRGTAAFVFVPFEDADTDILNLPVDKMDFYVPG
ncbi:unnamed protein product [Closterium sp. Naga37s-1]|nr:unnamed protein product [Closterium sp. Naga37s-1]